MKQTLRYTKARIVLMLNIMTKRGETDGYRAEDFVRTIETKIGRPCDVILYNNAPIPEEALLRYRAEQKVKLSSGKLKQDPRLLRMPLLGITPEGFLYHDPDAIGKAFKNNSCTLTNHSWASPPRRRPFRYQLLFSNTVTRRSRFEISVRIIRVSTKNS